MEPTPDDDLPRGTQVGEYQIEGVAGRGSFGTVYRAVHPLIGKLAAVKVLNLRYSVDKEVVSRFLSEARAVNQIRHQNIIDIFSFGQLSDGRQYYIMEYLDGVGLEQYLKDQGPLDLAEALTLLAPIASALDAAHQCGIAHRDLKPANIFLARRTDQSCYPKLLDFGIAKLFTEGIPKQHQTASGMAVGTPFYMAPEQCQGLAVDHRVDIYAFGVMCYQVLSGHLPFADGSTVEILMKHISEMPRPPSTFFSGLNPATDAAILAMLAKDPADRPSTVSAALALLKDAAKGSAVDTADVGIAAADTHIRTPARRVTQKTTTGFDEKTDSNADSAKTHTISGLQQSSLAEPLVGRGLASFSGKNMRRGMRTWPLALTGAGLAFGLTWFLGQQWRNAATEIVELPVETSTPTDNAVVDQTPLAPTHVQAPSVITAPVETPAVQAPQANVDGAPKRVSVMRTFTIAGVPSGTSVRDESGELLATAPGVLSVKNKDLPMTVLFTKAGYNKVRRVLRVDGPNTLRITMTRAKKRNEVPPLGIPSPRADDVENWE